MIFVEYIENNSIQVQEKFKSKQYRLEWINNSKYYVAPSEIKFEKYSDSFRFLI